jgi:hypothetical protein
LKADYAIPNVVPLCLGRRRSAAPVVKRLELFLESTDGRRLLVICLNQPLQFLQFGAERRQASYVGGVALFGG